MNPPTLPLLLFGGQAAAFWPLAGWVGSPPRPRLPPASLARLSDFLAFCPKPPWEVTQAGLERWVAHLTARGLAAGYIYKKLCALSPLPVSDVLYRPGRGG